MENAELELELELELDLEVEVEGTRMADGGPKWLVDGAGVDGGLWVYVVMDVALQHQTRPDRQTDSKHQQ